MCVCGGLLGGRGGARTDLYEPEPSPVEVTGDTASATPSERIAAVKAKWDKIKGPPETLLT